MSSRVVVLASGGGTNLQALLDSGHSAFRIVGVITDRSDAKALTRASQAGVPTSVVSIADFTDRDEWDLALASAIESFQPDWIVCAGFMRILGEPVVARFAQRIVNTHPALLPSFPGAHAVRDALDHGVRVTGCTVHLVDAGVDTGPIIAQRAVEILPDDDESILQERIKRTEHSLIVDVVARLSEVGCTVEGRKVSIP